MPQRPRHGEKDVEKALLYAEANGFRVQFPWGHWGRITCPGGCWAPVWNSPKNPTTHAKGLRRKVDHCEHRDKGGEE